MSSFDVFSQSHAIDSLTTLLNGTKDNNKRARIYIALSNEYWSDNPEMCLEFAKKALVISYGNEKSSITYEAYKNMGTACSFKGNFNDALRYDKMSYTEAVKMRNDSLIGQICVGIADDYTMLAKYDSANVFLDLGIKIAKRSANTILLTDLYLNKGNNLYYASKIELAEASYAEGLRIAIKQNNENAMAQFYNNIASIRLIRGIADSLVFSYINKAIRINEKHGKSRDIGDNYATLASAYSLQKNNEKTLEYLRLSYQTFFKIDNKVKAIPALCSIADLFRETNHPDSALFYADMAISIGEGSGYIHGLGTAYSVKGVSMAAINDFKSAELYLRKAYSEFIEINAAEGILFSGNQLVSVLIREKKLESAKDIALNVLEIAETTANKQYIRNITQNLAELNYLKGNYKSAYEYLQRAYSISDTLTKTENKRILDELQLKYQTEKNLNEIEILRLKRDQQQMIIDRQQDRERSIVLIGITGLALILTALTLIFVVRRNNRRNEKVMNELKISESKLNVLKARMNPHFMYNSLSNILGLVNEKRNSEAEKSLIMLSDLSRKILDNTDEKRISLEQELYILKEYLDLEKTGRSFEYNIEVDPGTKLSEIFVPPLILQPVAENSIHHGFRDAEQMFKIGINISTKDENCVIELTDNGKGIDNTGGVRSIYNNKGKSYGLKAVKESLTLYSLMNNLKTTFTMINRNEEDAELSGIKVVIEIELPQ